MNPAALLPASALEWLRVAIVALLVAAATVPLAYCEGKDAERAEWQRKAAELKAAQERRARVADEARRAELGRAGDVVTREREELDRETENLPDESPSARRRARICRELRDDARRRGAAGPAC